LKAKTLRAHRDCLQVENEPNITEQDHDYAPEAMAVLTAPFPLNGIAMKAAGKGMCMMPEQAGGKESGIWLELFGQAAGVISHTWGLATCIDAVAKPARPFIPADDINIAGRR